MQSQLGTLAWSEIVKPQLERWPDNGTEAPAVTQVSAALLDCAGKFPEIGRIINRW